MILTLRKGDLVVFEWTIRLSFDCEDESMGCCRFFFFCSPSSKWKNATLAEWRVVHRAT